MPFTIEIHKAGEEKPEGGVSYITEEECRRVYNGLAFFDPFDPENQKYTASMLDENDKIIESKDIDDFGAKVLLGEI